MRPECICYPAKAILETHRELACRVPNMLVMAEHVCIIAGEWAVLQELEPSENRSNGAMLQEAQLGPKPVMAAR
jgi:hypothetical protein